MQDDSLGNIVHEKGAILTLCALKGRVLLIWSDYAQLKSYVMSAVLKGFCFTAYVLASHGVDHVQGGHYG